MAKPTIAQLREKAVRQLALRKVKQTELTFEELEKAKHIMNCYYRLCGIDDKLVVRQNDERLCNNVTTRRLEEQSAKAYKKLDKILKEEYDAELAYFGIVPTICKKGTTQDLYLAYFYN